MKRYLDTASGHRIALPLPKPEDIELDDVALGLSRICRFGAQALSFYSVAQHAIEVASLVEIELGRPDLALAALHHDSHEAYIGDLPRPIKDLLKDEAPPGWYVWNNLERAFDSAIERSLNFSHPSDRNDLALIKRADVWALLMEAEQLLPDRGELLRGTLDDASDPPRRCPPSLCPQDAYEAFRAADDRLRGQPPT